MSDLIQTQNRNTHRPHHIYSGHTYFVTGRCYEGKKYFCDEKRKRIFQNVLKRVATKERVGIFAWVLLDNHYHMLITLHPSTDTMIQEDKFRSTAFVTPYAQQYAKGVTNEALRSLSSTSTHNQTLVRFIKQLHATSSKDINKHDQHKGRAVWYQYFDYCIRNIPDFWKHFNYILKNPLKHGLVHSLEESLLYPHSSNPTWLRKFGTEGIHKGFCKYPVREITT